MNRRKDVCDVLVFIKRGKTRDKENTYRWVIVMWCGGLLMIVFRGFCLFFFIRIKKRRSRQNYDEHFPVLLFICSRIKKGEGQGPGRKESR